MSQAPLQILTVNSGSTSIKFALYGLGTTERRLLSARCEGIGLAQGRCHVVDETERTLYDDTFSIADHITAARRFLDWLGRQSLGFCFDGIGHRIVHGGYRFVDPVVLAPEVEQEIGALSRLDPEHLVPQLRVVQVLRELSPGIPQVACFDTAFHRQMPRIAQMLPLPRELWYQGIMRFGAHGLSYQFLLEELGRQAGDQAARGRVVMAHLGGAASMVAVLGGRSVDNTTGFMPNGGLMMGTRSGDVSPAVLMHLLLNKGLSPIDVNDIVNFQSGLLGVSRVSRDMRELLRISGTNVQAAEAVDLFCYIARKHLGSLAAALGGIDTLVFSGGIGEHAHLIRKKICEPLGHLGIHVDASLNRQNGAQISLEGAPVDVRVITTNEERVIARAVGPLVRAGASGARVRGAG